MSRFPVLLLQLTLLCTVYCSTGTHHYNVTIAKTTTYSPKNFTWSEDVLLDYYQFMNPDGEEYKCTSSNGKCRTEFGYSVKIAEDVCTRLSLPTGEQIYKDNLKVQVSLNNCAVDKDSGRLIVGSTIAFPTSVDGEKYNTSSKRQAQANLADNMPDIIYSRWLIEKMVMSGNDTFKTAVDSAVLQDYGFIEEWYNRDDKVVGEGDMYDYQTGYSLFKLCEVTEELGKNSKNFHDAVTAGVDCKNMNFYKCVSLCAVAELCKSVFFFEGPMDPALKEPRYLCVQLRVDFDDKHDDGYPFIGGYTWEQDFPRFECPGNACESCTYKSDGGITACKLREFLKTIEGDEAKTSPFKRRTGSKLVFLDHIASSRSSAYAEIQRYTLSTHGQDMGMAPDGETSVVNATATPEDCQHLNNTWTKVSTIPTLPVKHGEDVNLACPTGYLNTGSHKGICEAGGIVPAKLPPKCEPIVNGGWGEYGAWADCADFTRSRKRSCDSPAPLNGGEDCKGAAIETEYCADGTYPVPRAAVWSVVGFLVLVLIALAVTTSLLVKSRYSLRLEPENLYNDSVLENPGTATKLPATPLYSVPGKADENEDDYYNDMAATKI